MWKRRLEDYLQTHSDEEVISILTDLNLLSKRRLTIDELIHCTAEEKFALFHYWSTVIDKDPLSKYNVYLLEDALNIPRDFKKDKWRQLVIEFDNLSEEEQQLIFESITDTTLFDKTLTFEDISILSLNQKICLFKHWLNLYMEDDSLAAENNYFTLRCVLDNSCLNNYYII